VADDASPEPKPRSTVQWLIAYPALLLALGSGIPVMWDKVVAWKKGVETSQLAVLREQDALWSRNLGCGGVASTWEIDLPHGWTAKLTVCPETGDILLRYFPQGDGEATPRYRWMRLPAR
jgi:hypothetical protein